MYLLICIMYLLICISYSAVDYVPVSCFIDTLVNIYVRKRKRFVNGVTLVNVSYVTLCH